LNTLYHAHSGLRYVVLLAATAAVVALGYALFTGRSVRIASTLAAAFTGLLDLQILLGVGLVIGGIFPDAVVGHLVMMVFAAVVTHASSIIGQRSSSERRELGIRLAGIVLALALIVGGILAIGRGVLGTAPLNASSGSELLNADYPGARTVTQAAAEGAWIRPCLECHVPSSLASRCT